MELAGAQRLAVLYEDYGSYFFTGLGVESARLARETFGYDVLLNRSLTPNTTDGTSVNATELEAHKLVSDRLTAEKGALNAKGEAEKTRQHVIEKEAMGAQMQNELARVRVDTLNVTANNTQLEVQVKQVNEEIKEQDALVAKYEAESRRRHTEIEKKQHEIDLLNKKFEQMMAKRAGVEDLDEDAGPLEAAIVHIKKDIAAKQAESAELQRTWIKGQTELVTLQNQNAGVAEVLADRKAKLAILEQKRMRMDAQHESRVKALRELGRASDHMHLEMGKINRLVNEHAEKQQVFADSQ